MSCCGGTEEEIPLARAASKPSPGLDSNVPEEDDSDPFALYQCRRCRKVYKVAENNATACRYHSGRYGKRNTAVFSSTEWSCCKSLLKNEKGCREDRHRPTK